MHTNKKQTEPIAAIVPTQHLIDVTGVTHECDYLVPAGDPRTASRDFVRTRQSQAVDAKGRKASTFILR